MAGLTRSGFVAESFDDIADRIKTRLEGFNQGFDFSADSPDGQLIDIMTYELSLVWQQLGLVYDSYNPQIATGAALRNLGLITGLPYGVADRSYASVDSTGTAGTLIPAGTIVTNDNGDEFYYVFANTVPSSAVVVAATSGAIPVPAGSITTIKSPLAGWDAITQPIDGTEGALAMTENTFRTMRQQTVMRNAGSVTEQMQSRLLELGLEQVSVYNNDKNTVEDGVPANTVQVTVGDTGDKTDEEIAFAILRSNSMGCPTFGSTAADVDDSQGVTHTINFQKAVDVPVEMVVDVTFLSKNVAGATDNIVSALVAYVQDLKAGEDVIWSRLFGLITPYSQAQVNVLNIGTVAAASPTTSNIAITPAEYSSLTTANVTLTVDGV